MDANRKLILTAAMFALAVAVVALASATGEAAYLFLAFIPLLMVPWILTRPEKQEPTERAVGTNAGDPYEDGTRTPG